MTQKERLILMECMKDVAPELYTKYQSKQQQIIRATSSIIDTAFNCQSDNWKEVVTSVYNKWSNFFNKTETYLLNYICYIKHKEKSNNGVIKEDEEIKKWMEILLRYRDKANKNELKESVNYNIDQLVRNIINQYSIKNEVGRPKGTGKRKFVYNNKEYSTIQQCADDYNISKQGMRKRLLKLHII